MVSFSSLTTNSSIPVSKNVGDSPRTIAGRRLHNQGQQRSERIEYLRQISRTTPNPEMKLATKNHEKPLNWGTSPSARFLALYEQGKNRLSSERISHKNLSGESKSSLKEVIAKYANTRQVQLYERGRQKLINDRQRQSNVTENHTRLSDVKIRGGYANSRLIELYELGKQRINQKRKIMHEVEQPQKKPLYTNTRIRDLHELGKDKVFKSRARAYKKKQ